MFNITLGLYKESASYSHCQNLTWNELANELAFADINFPIAILKNWSHVNFIVNDVSYDHKL